MKVVITMTSWKKRIQYVGKSIYMFFSTQSIKPDLFYLWLAEEEFPDKENELPEDLLLTCKYFNILIKWTKYNEYNHKRWYVYPEHFNDFVISIDDDQIFDKDLIKDALEKYKQYENKNVSFNIFKKITSIMIPHGNIDYERNKDYDETPSIKMNMNACHIFPPKTFPLNAISEDNIKIRRRICKRCDESWILPFLKAYDGKITYLNDKSILNRLPYGSDETATYRIVCKNVNGFKKRDIQLYTVLRQFPDLMKKWKNIFPEYIDNTWKDKSIDELIKMINS